MSFTTPTTSPSFAIETLATDTPAAEFLRESLLQTHKADFLILLFPIVVITIFLTLWPDLPESHDHCTYCHLLYDNSQYEREYEDWTSHPDSDDDWAEYDALDIAAYEALEDPRSDYDSDDMGGALEDPRSVYDDDVRGNFWEAYEGNPPLIDLGVSDDDEQQSSPQATCGRKRTSSLDEMFFFGGFSLPNSPASSSSGGSPPGSRKMKLIPDVVGGGDGELVVDETPEDEDDGESGTSSEGSFPFTFRATPPWIQGQ
ncbi:MAG: hypothetical protein Q9220_004668 [cf. Caloplaca sp. 1 TL-2023]